MNERSQDAWTSEPLQMRARLGEAAADALHGADAEASADQRIERDAARHDVPSCVLPRDADVVERFGLDERQLVAALAAERAAAVRIAVALEPAPRDRLDRLDADERALSLQRDEQADDFADPDLGAPRLVDRHT